MENSAHRTQKQVLLTNAATYLGIEIAKHLISENYHVYADAKSKVPEDLVLGTNFTLLDLNLTQPLPQHLPEFDLIIHLAQELSPNSLQSHLPPTTANILNIAHKTRTNVLLLAPINIEAGHVSAIAKAENIKDRFKLLLTGDVYGPSSLAIGNSHRGKNHFLENNSLTHLIAQAVYEDRIILENDGLDHIYPLYIDDAILAIKKFTSEESDDKLIHFVISESPKTELTIAYEIQKTAGLALGKHLNLYFSGPEKSSQDTEPIVKINELTFRPKTKIEDGLKETFEYFAKHPHQRSKSPEAAHHKPLSAKLVSATSKEEKQESSRKIKAKKYLSFGRISMILTAIIILIITKTILDLYLGAKNLSGIKSALITGDLIKAKSKAEHAQKNFSSAGNTLNIITLSGFLNNKLSIVKIADSAQSAATSLVYFTDAAQNLNSQLVSVLTAGDSPISLNVEESQANFKRSYFEAARAIETAKNASHLPFLSKYQQAEIENLEKLKQLSLTSQDIVNILPTTISGDKKTYLVLLENNMELRPGGGFIGSYAQITFEKGHLTNIKVDDIYNIDGQLKEKIEPPPEIKDKLNTPNFYLRDSNWSTDGEVNARTAQDLYKKETGIDVDGVITVDLDVVKDILAKTGSINLPEYNETIDQNNLFEKGEYHAEIGFTPGSTQKKDFFAILTKRLLDKITTGITAGNTKDKVSLVSLSEALSQAISEKHMTLSFVDPSLSSTATQNNWNHKVPPPNFNLADSNYETKDYIGLSEANLGASKVNREIERKINYEQTVEKNSDLTAKLAITYTNHGQANTWPIGTYINFLRVYTPANSNLLNYQLDEGGDMKDVKSEESGNFTVFSTFVEVPIKTTKTVTFTYKLAKIIDLGKAPIYHLYVQKQPGTENDQFTFIFNLPGFLKAKTINTQSQNKQNLIVNTNLDTDNEYTIEIAKN